MKVLRVKKFPIFDVFFGEGWEDWTRVLLKGTHLIYLGGAERPHATFKAIHEQINGTKKG